MLRDPHRTLEDIERLPTKTMVGERLDGRYELKEIIGEGGMGVVFKATQLSVNRDVAIKVMKSELFEEFGLMKRFKLEMEIISSLQHPNIVRLLDTGIDARLGVVFLVMEFIEGVCLGDLLYNTSPTHTLASELAIEIAIQVCSALTEPHRLGVIHRDLKPDNIILTVRSDEQLDVKLLDFGVARIISPNERIDTTDTGRLTATGGIVGTPPYIAPELCESSRSVSVKSDLYAVGALLFELLTGAPPFMGRSTAEVLYKHVHEPVPSLTSASSAPEPAKADLEALINNLLAKDPEKRPESALHVKRMLTEICDLHGISRPHLHYTEEAPTIANFSHHIIEKNKDFSPPYLLSPTLDAPVETLPRAPRSATQSSYPRLQSYHTQPEATPRHTPLPDVPVHRTLKNEDTTSPDLAKPERFLSKKEATIALGVLLIVTLLGGAAASLISLETSSNTHPPALTTLAQQEEMLIEPPGPALEPRKPTPEPIQKPDLTPALTHTSSALHEALSMASSASKSAHRESSSHSRTRNTSPERHVATTPPLKSSTLNKKIDWLYTN